MNLFDTQNARAEKMISEFCRSEDELIELVQVAVRKLLGGERWLQSLLLQERCSRSLPQLAPNLRTRNRHGVCFH